MFQEKMFLDQFPVWVMWNQVFFNDNLDFCTVDEYRLDPYFMSLKIMGAMWVYYKCASALLFKDNRRDVMIFKCIQFDWE